MHRTRIERTKVLHQITLFILFCAMVMASRTCFSVSSVGLGRCSVVG